MSDVRVEVIEGEPMPPPTQAQREWIREAVREVLAAQMKPLLGAWDQRSLDMLAVLGEAGDARRQVRQAAATIKLAGWVGVAVMVLAVVGLWVVLERERADRRESSDVDALRRLETAQMIMSSHREEGRRLEQLVHDCAKAAAPPGR